MLTLIRGYQNETDAEIGIFSRPPLPMKDLAFPRIFLQQHCANPWQGYNQGWI